MTHPVHARDLSAGIPQHALDHYHAHYHNPTFKAFSTVLAQAMGLDERVARLELYNENHHRITSLLIDASLEVSGAAFYDGASRRLGQALGGLDEHTPALVKLATDHLQPFADGERRCAGLECIAWLVTLAMAEYSRRVLVQTLGEAALLPGYRCTAAYYWLLASTLVIQSAEIVLRQDPDANYLAEKFGKGLDLLAVGMQDLAHSGSVPHVLQNLHDRLKTKTDHHAAPE
jgi:hypothetical protein